MTRNTRDTRAELIEAATKLFAEKGIPNTAVSDIVREVGVAQGTFYWHFKSKQEVVNGIVESIAERNCRRLKEITQSNEMSALEKLAVFANEIFSELISDSDVLRYFHNEGNGQAHDYLNKELAECLVPLLAEIISQGVDEKIFKVADPDKAAAFSFGAALLINEKIIADGGDITAWKKAVLDFVLRGLGCDQSLIAMVKKEIAGR